jgi:hypothetical protein
MSLFPEFNRVKIVEESDGLGIDFLFDGENHVFDERNKGELKVCNTFENLVQWIGKIVGTAKGAFEVYVRDESESFGVSIYEFLGQKKNLNYALSELKREVTEQIEASVFVDEVSEYTTKRSGSDVIVSFKCVLSDKIRKNEVYTRQSGSGSIKSTSFDIECDGNIKEGVIGVEFKV